MSFQEKSLWVLFVGLLVSFSLYFMAVLPPITIDVMPNQIVLFTVAVILLVITQIAGHLLLVIFDRRTETDERDQLIELKGTRNAAYILATGVFTALCVAIVTEGNFLFVHVLLAFWVLAQLVEIGSQLVFYRRGI